MRLHGCLNNLQKDNDNYEIKKVYESLINKKHEIYKGNEEVINEIIEKARMIK